MGNAVHFDCRKTQTRSRAKGLEAMTFAPEQLRQFAEAGGWTDITHEPSYRSSGVIPNDGRRTLLPDFPNDLAACFEVLEFKYVRYDLIVSAGGCSISLFDSDRNWFDMGMGPHWFLGPKGKTKQEAIIAAVLAAKEANDRH